MAGMNAPVPRRSKCTCDPVVQEITKPTALTAPKIEEELAKLGSIPNSLELDCDVAIAPPLETGEGDEVSRDVPRFLMPVDMSGKEELW